MFSRTASLLKSARLLNQKSVVGITVRNSHACNYRKAYHNNPKWVVVASELVMAYAWWWVLWHLFTEPDHITGEFPFPDVKKWTDEELGIPPDE